MWKDPALARRWSENPARMNPIRSEHLDMLLTLLQDHYQPGKAILDLGFGSGLIEELIFQNIPDAYIVGVDVSPAMMEIAAQRLQPFRDQYTAVEHDLADIDSLQLPAREYQIVFSSQTLHHLTADQMQATYAFIYRTLEAGGYFFLLDRIAVDKPGLFGVVQSLWRRIDRHSQSKMLEYEGATFEEHTRNLHDGGDLPQSLESHLRWLGEAGFEADCLHCHTNRAFIAARKRD
jgi:tRNA (cmo5U34)-methyltransferase